MQDPPSQSGRVAVVTGANTGLGFATAQALAERGGHVVLAVRDPARGADAANRINGSTSVVRLDLASLDSIRSSGHRTDRPMSRDYRHAAAYRDPSWPTCCSPSLHRRLTRAGATTQSLAAHPGGAWTGMFTGSNHPLVVHTRGRLVTQSAEHGAWPTLRAATDPEAEGGQYYSPSGLGQLKGAPVLVQASARAHDPALARRLWTESERPTGIAYKAL